MTGSHQEDNSCHGSAVLRKLLGEIRDDLQPGAHDSGSCLRRRVSCLPQGLCACESKIGTMRVDHEIAGARTWVNYRHTELMHYGRTDQKRGPVRAPK
jgi:hypothetical protein